MSISQREPIADARAASIPAFLPSDGRPRREGCVQDELLPDGGMVLYHTCRKRMMTLNQTAALVWTCCEGNHDLAAIVAELREVFPDAPDLERDVIAVLYDLARAGMLFPPAA